MAKDSGKEYIFESPCKGLRVEDGGSVVATFEPHCVGPNLWVGRFRTTDAALAELLRRRKEIREVSG